MEVSIKSFDQLTCGELYEILQARTAIFIVEQACSYQDIDGVDRQALQPMVWCITFCFLTRQSHSFNKWGRHVENM